MVLTLKMIASTIEMSFNKITCILKSFGVYLLINRLKREKFEKVSESKKTNLTLTNKFSLFR